MVNKWNIVRNNFLYAPCITMLEDTEHPPNFNVSIYIDHVPFKNGPTSNCISGFFGWLHGDETWLDSTRII